MMKKNIFTVILCMGVGISAVTMTGCGKNLTSETAALTAALTMEHISKDISKNISHIAHVTIFEMVFMIAAASLTEAAKSAAKATLAMEALVPAISTSGTCAFFKSCEAILVVQFLLLVIT